MRVVKFFLGSNNLRLVNLQRLHTRCVRELNSSMLVVPGDGNCLLWSLRALLMGPKLGSLFCGKHILESLQKMREVLKKMWLDVSKDPYWQGLFMAHLDGLYAFPQTPEKKPAAKDHDNAAPEHTGDGLETPPRPQAPRKQRKPFRERQVDEAKPVPLAVPPPVAANFKGPSAGKALGLEPEVPDFEAMYDASLRKYEPGSLEAEMMGEDEDGHKTQTAPVAKRHKREHRRSCKRRKPTETQQKQKKMKALLARAGASYGVWMSRHREAAIRKKTTVCKDGGYAVLQNKLLTGVEPSCPICLNFLTERNLTLSHVQEVLSCQEEEPVAEQLVEEDPAGGEQDDQEQHQDEVQQETQREMAHQRSQREAIERYFESMRPTVSLMRIDEENLKVFFRCHICVSRKNPDGKVNCGGRPTLNSVKHFVQKHFESMSHMAMETRRNGQAQQPDPGAQPAANPGTSLVQDDKCHGYRLCDDSGGTLQHYRVEFGIWASHAQLEGRTQHRYSLDASTGVWKIYHGECTGKVETGSGNSICQLCEFVGGPRGVVRLVVKFVAKYFLAILLSKRLFQSCDDIKEFLKEVEGSVFGINNFKFWRSLRDMNLLTMQNFVKDSFVHMNAAQTSPNLKRFISEVVRPSAKVNVASIEDGMASLTAHFVTALSSQRLNAPWRIQGGRQESPRWLNNV